MKFQAPTGMHDILSDDFRLFHKIEKVCEELADFYGFERIETPILEEFSLFEKGTGITSEIVQKQMFILNTKLYQSDMVPDDVSHQAILDGILSGDPAMAENTVRQHILDAGSSLLKRMEEIDWEKEYNQV